MVKQLTTRLTNDLLFNYNPMNLSSGTVPLTYGYLNLGSRFKRVNFLLKTMTYS